VTSSKYSRPVELDPATEGRLRKHVYELTADDLRRVPVWEFTLDEETLPGQDETTVRPRPDVLAVDYRGGMFVVRARFVARDRTEFLGHADPDPYAGGMQHPHIVTTEGHVGFWWGIREPSQEDLTDAYRRLGTTADHLFPLRFEGTVALAGPPLQGTLLGFYWSSQPLGSDPPNVVR
jgi:hypothetical protein